MADQRALESTLSEEDLLSVAIDLSGGKNPALVSQDAVIELKRIAGVPGADAGLTRGVLRELIDKLKAKLGMEKFERVVGEQISRARLALLPEPHTNEAIDEDFKNMQRGWGWSLLPADDVAYRDPAYLARLVRESGSTGEVMDLPQVASDAKPPVEFFNDAWKKIAPANVEPPKLFTLTGTDANNLLYDIADRVVASHEDVAFTGRNHAEILAFDGVYGGGTGRVRKLSKLATLEKNDDLLITSPDSSIFHPTDPAEIHRLKALEDRAIREIQDKVKRADPPIGGVLLEPVLGISKVRFYRTEFLLRLRKVCDDLKIPIFADEVLTGGGRTGKFFAYQHYEGFDPDFVTFGKGLQVAGVARVSRGEGAPVYPYGRGLTTLTQTHEALLKSAQVMNRIREGDLMKNAAEVGAYFVQKLRERDWVRLNRELKAARSSYERATRFRSDQLTRLQMRYEKMSSELRLTEANPRYLQRKLEALKRTYDSDVAQVEKGIQYWKSAIVAKEHELQMVRHPVQDTPDSSHGLGMLIYTDSSPNVKGALGRLLPPLTLSREQVDSLFPGLRNP